jgi:phage baseplate assembly protein W
MEIAFPFRIDFRGRTASSEGDDHIRDLIEQVLFTMPGERVNRPDFGSGLMQQIFEPSGSECAATTQFLAQGALQQWLGDLIRVEEISAKSVDAVLHVTVSYETLRSREHQTVNFEFEV